MTTTIIKTVATFEPENHLISKKHAPLKKGSPNKYYSIIDGTTMEQTYLQTPRSMTWGICDYENDKRFNIQLQLNTADDEVHREFADKIDKFEYFMKRVVMEEKLMGDVPLAVIEQAFYPSLKRKPNKPNEPVFKAKLYTTKTEDFNVNIYSTSRTMLYPNELGVHPRDIVCKFDKVVCIVTPANLWVGAKSWGITWKLEQVLITDKSDGGGFNSGGVCLI